MHVSQSDFYGGPGDWVSRCFQVDFVNAKMIYAHNGEIHFQGSHNGLKPMEGKKSLAKLSLMKNLNVRIADVFLASHDIGIDEIIGYTTCEQELDQNLVSFRPGSWGLSGTDRNPDVGDPMFVPQEFCSSKKLLVLPPEIFMVNTQRCLSYGKKSLTFLSSNFRSL